MPSSHPYPCFAAGVLSRLRPVALCAHPHVSDVPPPSTRTARGTPPRSLRPRPPWRHRLPSHRSSRCSRRAAWLVDRIIRLAHLARARQGARTGAAGRAPRSACAAPSERESERARSSPRLPCEPRALGPTSLAPPAVGRRRWRVQRLRSGDCTYLWRESDRATASEAPTNVQHARRRSWRPSHRRRPRPTAVPVENEGGTLPYGGGRWPPCDAAYARMGRQGARCSEAWGRRRSCGRAA